MSLSSLIASFRAFPVQLFDPQKESLPGSTVGAKGFPEGYLLANPLDLFDDLLSNPMQKIGVGRIGNVLGLRGGIHGHPSGLYQAHIRPGREQHRLYLFHPLSADPIPELHQGRGFQDLLSLKSIEPTETLPVGIFMKHLHGPFV